MRLARRPLAVVFDLDGVLLDTEPLYTRALSKLVARFGKQYSWELKSRTMGTHPRHGARVVIDALDLPVSVEEWLRLREIELRALFAEAPAMPGAREFVKELKGRDIPCAIATSSERPLCELKWGNHDWLQAFDVAICGDDPGIERLKPAPDIYLEAARRLKQRPEDCLVFEDSPAGVAAARAAGMQVVAIKAPELPLELVRDANWVVGAYAEVSLADCGLA